jgi:hypothetical protein
VRRTSARLAFLAVLLVACATGGTSATGSASSASNSRLTSEEIVAANLPTAYDLVERLRRPWLRRDAATGQDVTVYMDNQKLGGVETLREIPAVDVAEMEYVPSDKAIMCWGQDAKGGAIVVTRKR